MDPKKTLTDRLKETSQIISIRVAVSERGPGDYSPQQLYAHDLNLTLSAGTENNPFKWTEERLLDEILPALRELNQIRREKLDADLIASTEAALAESRDPIEA
jgi:hypothetical protein